MSGASRLELPEDVYVLRTRLRAVLAAIQGQHASMQEFAVPQEGQEVGPLEVHARMQETLVQQYKALEIALEKRGAGIGLVQIEDLLCVIEGLKAGVDANEA